MPLAALRAHRWTGAVLRSLNHDLETRTLVLELHPETLDTGLCLRIVVTNCDCTITGQLTSSGIDSRRLIMEPMVAAEPQVVARNGVAVPVAAASRAVFATAGGRVVIEGGIASIDEYALDEADAPLNADDLAVLEDWRRAA